MFKRLLALFFCLCMTGCYSDRTIAWESPGVGVRLEMVLSPVWSLQSDWERTLTIVAPGGSASLHLFQDTGWWRGSNLYDGGQGTWVLDEGQLGCVSIVLDPPAVATAPCPERASDEGSASLRFETFKFVGYFSEGSRKDEPRFVDRIERAETILPDEL
jgi:hypothetical protein